MNDNEKKELAKRHADARDEILAALDAIFAKSQESLTSEDKAFLRARQSYLTRSQLADYAEELKQPTSEYDDMTNADLVKILEERKVEIPKKYNHQTLLDLIAQSAN